MPSRLSVREDVAVIWPSVAVLTFLFGGSESAINVLRLVDVLTQTEYARPANSDTGGLGAFLSARV